MPSIGRLGPYPGRVVYIISVAGEVPVVGRKGNRPYFTKTMPEWDTVRAPTKIALVLVKASNAASGQDGEAYQLTHLGAVVRSPVQKASTYDRRLKVEELFALPGEPLAMGELLARLPETDRGQLTGLEGRPVRTLAEESGQAVIRALQSLRPDAAPIIQWLQALDQPGQFGAGLVDQIWQLERDAANVALRIADISPTPLRAWQRPRDEEQPFSAGLVSLPPQPQSGTDASSQDEAPDDLLGLVPRPGEQAMIENDARTFGGWTNVSRNVHINTFTDGGRRVSITNVNAGRVEARVGVDLVYYHVNTKSFVLVQYKRLIDKDLLVDQRLRDQLARLEELSKFNEEAAEPDQWRIGPDFAFLKLAHGLETDRVAFGMIPGLYLPLSYARILLRHDTTLGERGGRRLGYGTVSRYLSNKQFIDLAAHGLVGTIGISVSQLKRIVDGLLTEGDGIVIAADYSNETTVERQRRLRSRDPNRSASRRTGTAR